MLCPESLRVQAYVDGELDAPSSLAVEQHLAHCASCQPLRVDLESMRSALRQDLRSAQAPEALRRRVMVALDEEPDRTNGRTPSWHAARRTLPVFWRGAFSGFGAAAALALLMLWARLPVTATPVVDDLLAAHVGALMSGRLVEVESTDRHTVKPWFAGRIDVSPLVADFSAQGYRLIGGRIDRPGRQPAAVLVYRHGAHVVSVYCWAAHSVSMPGDATRKGYHLAFWREDDLAYAAVSDTGWDELQALERLIRGLDKTIPQGTGSG